MINSWKNGKSHAGFKSAFEVPEMEKIKVKWRKKVKYLLIVKLQNGDLTTVIFDSMQHMDEYLENMHSVIEDVILKIAFNTEKGSNYVNVL